MAASPQTGASVVVVEDDHEIRAIVHDALTEQGFVVTDCPNGDAALTLIRSRMPSLVILDLGLPGMSGLDVLREIREIGDLPVIVLTGRSGETDRVVGLEMGADDYIVKPFSPRELAARAKAVLRRSDRSSDVLDQLHYGDLVIDLTSRDVAVNGIIVSLTAKEFDLLAFLASSPRRVFTREELLRNVWGSEPEWQDASTVAEHVHRLRRKIEPDPGTPKWIVTKRGAGYRFSP